MQLTDRLFHANAAVRAMIAWQALEELGGVRPPRKLKPEGQQASKRASGWSRSREAIDLSFPAPPSWRPATREGATSFHFAFSAISKARPATASGTEGPPAMNAASGFERYVTAHDPATNRAVGAERYVVDEGEGTGGSRTAFVISNISDDPRAREAFWDAAHAASATPSLPRLEIRPHRGDLAELARLADEDDTPAAVRTALRKLVGQLTQKDSGDPPRVHSVDLDEAAFGWAQMLDQDRYGGRRDDRLVHVVRPRGGVLQWRIEAEFAYELDGDDDLAVAEEFGRMLDRLGLKYTIAAHHPTHRNDLRNRHPHILIYPGACRRGSDGSWDFGRKLQAGDIALGLGAADKATLAKLWFEQRSAADVAALRCAFADIVNARLDRRGVRRRYDPRTFAQMGIDQAPGEHLGSAAATRVEAGDAIDIDRRNAIKGWEGRRRQVAREIAAEVARHRAVSARVEAIGATDRDTDLVALCDQHTALTDRLAGLLELLADRDLATEMARSAADRLAARSGDALAAIEAGTASAAEVRATARYRARNELALAHLDAVDDALEPHADAVKAARAEVAGMRRALHASADRITARIAQQEQRAQVAARRAATWSRDTVLLPARHPTPLDDEAHFEALVAHSRNQRSAEWATPAERFVRLVRVGGSSDHFMPVGLRAADEALIAREPFARRFAGVMREAGQRQEEEIGRVIAYIAAHGENGLLADDAGAAPRTVRRHYQLYQDHPTFCDRLQSAKARFAAVDRRQVAVTEGIEMTPATPTVASLPDHAGIPAAALPVDSRKVAPEVPKASTATLSPTPENDPKVSPVSPSHDLAQSAVQSPSASATPVAIRANRPAADHRSPAAQPASPDPRDTAAEATFAMSLPGRADGSTRPSASGAPPAAKVGVDSAPVAPKNGRPDRPVEPAGSAITALPSPPSSTTDTAKSMGQLRAVAPDRSDDAATPTYAERQIDDASAGASQTDSRPPAGTLDARRSNTVTTASLSETDAGVETSSDTPDTETESAPIPPIEQAPRPGDDGSSRTTQLVARIASQDAPNAGAAAGDVNRPDREVGAPPPLPADDSRTLASPTEHLRDLVRRRQVQGAASPPEPSLELGTRPTPAAALPIATSERSRHDHRLRTAREVVATFRANTLYTRFDDMGRRAFDQNMREPLNDLVAGRASLRIARGALLVTTASDEVEDHLRAFAVSDAGYWLLVRLAEALPADPAGFEAWQVLDQRGSAPSLPPTGRQAPGIGD